MQRISDSVSEKADMVGGANYRLVTVSVLMWPHGLVVMGHGPAQNAFYYALLTFFILIFFLSHL